MLSRFDSAWWLASTFWRDWRPTKSAALYAAAAFD
jgi:hypothetical protein